MWRPNSQRTDAHRRTAVTATKCSQTHTHRFLCGENGPNDSLRCFPLVKDTRIPQVHFNLCSFSIYAYIYLIYANRSQHEIKTDWSYFSWNTLQCLFIISRCVSVFLNFTAFIWKNYFGKKGQNTKMHYNHHTEKSDSNLGVFIIYFNICTYLFNICLLKPTSKLIILIFMEYCSVYYK